METHITRIEKKALLIGALKEKQIITNNHRTVVKKNKEHNYLIKKHKLNLNEKNIHPLYVPNKIVTREQHL